MTKLFLIRHGQTDWNHNLKYQGHADTSLSPMGEQQARLLARHLRDVPFTAIYASDLKRAFDTARIVAAAHNLPVQVVPQLREIKFGAWEGLTSEEIEAGWPDSIKRLYTEPDALSIPGGESFRQLRARATAAVHTLVQRHPHDTVAVVSHGGTIRTIICAALGIDLNHVWNIRQDNTAVNILEYFDDRVVLALLNDCHHLTDMCPRDNG